jgi:hypothetical protein
MFLLPFLSLLLAPTPTLGDSQNENWCLESFITPLDTSPCLSTAFDMLTAQKITPSFSFKWNSTELVNLIQQNLTINIIEDIFQQVPGIINYQNNVWDAQYGNTPGIGYHVNYPY